MTIPPPSLALWTPPPHKQGCFAEIRGSWGTSPGATRWHESTALVAPPPRAPWRSLYSCWELSVQSHKMHFLSETSFCVARHFSGHKEGLPPSVPPPHSENVELNLEYWKPFQCLLGFPENFTFRLLRGWPAICYATSPPRWLGAKRSPFSVSMALKPLHTKFSCSQSSCSLSRFFFSIKNSLCLSSSDIVESLIKDCNMKT